jgi:hypothetical protein
MNGERVASASLLEPMPVWRWPVARWASFDECATALDLTPGELAWFADERGWHRRARPPLRHYSYRWIPTKSGGARLIERPKPRLAELQRRVRRHVLDALPVHDAAHGFRRGRSVHTCARPHAGQHLVARLDLAGFFPTISAGRIRSLLDLAGYPPASAAALAGILTTRTPVDVLRAAPARTSMLDRLAGTHLPQGAPSSPSVANAVTHRLDRRLYGLSQSLGAAYTRYADDLAFSGDATLPLHRLLPGVRSIVTDEGFRLRDDKTSVTPEYRQQRVAGLVVNAAPAVSRAEYDELRAVLHNCARTGPAEQNRGEYPDFRAQLLGRIGWIGAASPARGAKLRGLFERIDWR